ncbi:MAG: metallophosphoesterase [Gammaproteobacteria bacterium]
MANEKNIEQSITIAHLSDPHLTSLHGIHFRSLLNKRILGYLSWLKRRRFVHRREILDALERDLKQQNPNHIVVTGDLTHIGLPDEFCQARRWLESLGSSESVTVIPGNHDVYVERPWQENYLHWQSYMLSDEGNSEEVGVKAFFPSVRRRGSVVIIGLSSAVASAPFFATGKVGEWQLKKLAAILKKTAKESLFRIVLIHHPPLPGIEKWRKRLVDIEPFLTILKQYGAELVLHGHGHTAVSNVIETAAGNTPVIGVASASSAGTRAGKTAGYNIYRITPSKDGWQLEVAERVWRAAQNRFVSAGKKEI